MAYVGFGKLKGELAHKKGVTNPAGLAASIGRKKYGKKKFQKGAAKGETMENYAAKRNKQIAKKRNAS